jgi:transposase
MALVRWAARKGVPAGSWLARMLQRKPRMVVAVALANKNAHIIPGYSPSGHLMYAVSA